MKIKLSKFLTFSLIILWSISFAFFLFPNKNIPLVQAENPDYCSNYIPPYYDFSLTGKNLSITIDSNLSDKEFKYSIFINKKDASNTLITSYVDKTIAPHQSTKTTINSLSVVDEGDYVLNVVFVTGSCTYSSSADFTYNKTNFNPTCPNSMPLDISANFGSSGKVFPSQTVPIELKSSDTDYKTGATISYLDVITKLTKTVTLASNDLAYTYRVYYHKEGKNDSVDITNIKQKNHIYVGNLGAVESENINIPSVASGNYQLRIVIDDEIRKCQNFQLVDLPFQIAGTKGVVIYQSAKSATKGNTIELSAKFYGSELLGQNYSIYVDGVEKTKGKIGAEDTSYPSPAFPWDTSGTDPGPHEISVKVFPGIAGTSNNKTTAPITINAPSSTPGTGTPGGNSTGFSLSKLDSYNIKSLLSSCSTKTDLEGITCIIDKVIAWLLDIGAVISFIMILYASIIYLTSYGEESKAELAKKTLIWSVIGVVVIGAAKAIMLIINNYLIK